MANVAAVTARRYVSYSSLCDIRRTEPPATACCHYSHYRQTYCIWPPSGVGESRAAAAAAFPTFSHFNRSSTIGLLPSHSPPRTGAVRVTAAVMISFAYPGSESTSFFPFFGPRQQLRPTLASVKISPRLRQNIGLDSGSRWEKIFRGGEKKMVAVSVSTLFAPISESNS